MEERRVLTKEGAGDAGCGALQVGADFEYLGEAVKLKTVCVYGGAPMGAQEGALRRGVDVVVGTPGRVKVRNVLPSERCAWRQALPQPYPPLLLCCAVYDSCYSSNNSNV